MRGITHSRQEARESMLYVVNEDLYTIADDFLGTHNLFHTNWNLQLHGRSCECAKIGIYLELDNAFGHISAFKEACAKSYQTSFDAISLFSFMHIF
jgi:hypothetical protein